MVWLIVIALFGFFRDLKSPISLNELGGALAGVFAPVAFLWVVLGYVQQERALQLQIDEMKESVQQHVELEN